MRFIKVLIKVIIGLIIVAAIAGYLFIRNFDLNKYKSEISTLAEEQLGRKLAINGEAKLGISFTPTLIIEDVELANAEGASQPQMVTVGSLEVKLALLPLLKRQVVIDNVILQNPVINLEVAADGTSNWVFKKSGGQVSPQQIELMKDQAIATGLVDMKTADKAAEILQKRIDYQVGDETNPGGAWYPESIESWKQAQVIREGTYVAMIASAEHQADIAEKFQQQFQ